MEFGGWSFDSLLPLIFSIEGLKLNTIVKRLGLGLGTGTWDLGPGNIIENRESKLPPVPVLTVKSHWPPPLTFRGEGELWQQSAFSKNVSGWSPKPIQHKKSPGGQWEQQPGGVQHDQGEVYQKTHNF